MKRSTSLRWRVASWFAATFLLTLAPIVFTLHVALNRILLSDLDGDLSGFAETVAGEITTADGLVSPEAIRRAVQIATRERLLGAPLLTVVRAANGEILAASTPAARAALAPRPEDGERLRAGESVTRNAVVDGKRLRLHTRPVLGDGELVAVIQTAAPLGPVTRTADRLQELLIAEALAAVALATVAGLIVARRALRPLEEMAAVAADIEAHDLTRRLALPDAPAELARLAETFDAMLDRLERAFALQRTFVLDVAHELRTPLTALRGNLDVFLLDPALTGEQRTEVERLAAETARLTRLTTNLLSLAQAEAGRTIARLPVDLDVLCLEVYQQARTLRPDVRLRLGHEDQVSVAGDADLLKQLILNLVENAIKYSPPDGTVTLSLAHDDHAARIAVADQGSGIAPEDLPRIFDRFYRARGSGGRIAGGAGIGLAVARWIAEQHGGRIEVESTPGRGSTFTIVLPFSPPLTVL